MTNLRQKTIKKMKQRAAEYHSAKEALQAEFLECTNRSRDNVEYIVTAMDAYRDSITKYNSALGRENTFNLTKYNAHRDGVLAQDVAAYLVRLTAAESKKRPKADFSKVPKATEAQKAEWEAEIEREQAAEDDKQRTQLELKFQELTQIAPGDLQRYKLLAFAYTEAPGLSEFFDTRDYAPSAMKDMVGYAKSNKNMFENQYPDSMSDEEYEQELWATWAEGLARAVELGDKKNLKKFNENWLKNS